MKWGTMRGCGPGLERQQVIHKAGGGAAPLCILRRSSRSCLPAECFVTFRDRPALHAARRPALHAARCAAKQVAKRAGLSIGAL